MRLRVLVSTLIAASWLLGSGPPPALVATTEVEQGRIHPAARYMGTLHFSALSRVASQSAAAVASVHVQSGDRVARGDTMVVLDSAILEANIAAKEAEFHKIEATLQQALRDRVRFERLFAQNSISDQQLEQATLKTQELSMQKEIIAAGLQALKIEHQKRTIRAPFDGVVIERHVDLMEWVGPGGHVVSVAKSEPLEVHIHVSTLDLMTLEVNQKLKIQIGTLLIDGRVAGIVPMADSISRTFLVRIDLQPSLGLRSAQGLEAVVYVPAATQEEALLVHRDAVIERFNQQVVFAVHEGKAQMFPVEILGFDGLQAAVRSPHLKAGMSVITRGNERVFPNQAVRVQP